MMLVISGGVLALLAGLWSAIAVPTLVKYPTDLDVTIHYAGTFTLMVDPDTAAPLETPVTVPLTVDRHLEAIESESGASRVVVQETIVQKAGDLVDARQVNVYVMDRRTMENVADDRAYAFAPTNVVDRSGAYRLNLPFSTASDATYPIYKNEIATTYQMSADTQRPGGTEAGLQLDYFTASLDGAPVSPAYLTELDKSMPLPRSLSLDELKPHLLRAGIDVDALLAALVPVLAADDLAALMEIAGNPISLEYVLSFEGRAGVESTTGAEVDVGASESFGVRPRLADLPQLQAILARYPDVPEAAVANEALTAMVSGGPIEVFRFSYEQTEASVAEIASDVRAMRRQVLLARRYVPFGLVGFAVLALGTGVFLSWLGRPKEEPHKRPEDSHRYVPARAAKAEREEELVGQR
jgi:hypothetical protein